MSTLELYTALAFFEVGKIDLNYNVLVLVKNIYAGVRTVHRVPCISIHLKQLSSISSVYSQEKGDKNLFSHTHQFCYLLLSITGRNRNVFYNI